MSSTYHNKDRDDNPSGLTHSCHLFEKFLVRYPGSQKDAINLILSEKLDRNSLYSKFIEKLNIYENFIINLLPLDFTSQDSPEAADNTSFVIAKEKECEAFKKIRPDAVMISSTADDHYINIAYQRHLSNVNNNSSISLSEYRSSARSADAIIRSSSCLILDLNAIKVQDSFSTRSSITGLDVYEACAIARNAGMSENLQLFCLVVDDNSLHVHTQEVASLIFWYFLEGRKHRFTDSLSDNLITYLVQSNLYEDPIKFQKSKITGRWMVTDPITGDVSPCTESDYDITKTGEIPDVLCAL